MVASADARTLGGNRPTPETLVEISPWIRPLLLDGHAVLLLERIELTDAAPTWRMVFREIVKEH